MHTASSLLRNARHQWRDGRGKILIAIAAGWFLSIGVRLTYPVLLPYLRSAYGLTLSTSGLLLTVLWLAYALGQLPGGLLADRIGEGATMTASTLIAAGMLSLLVVGGSAPLLFLATASFGFATALFGVARFSSLSAIYPEQRGTAIGLISAAGEVGNTVLPPVAGLVAATVAWQLGFGFTIPLFLLAGASLWVVVPTRTSESSTSNGVLSRENARNVLSALSQPSIVLIVTIQLLGSAMWQAFTGFYPTYLIEMKGLSATVASGLFALFFAVGIVIKPLSGNAYDRVGARQTLLVLLSVSGVGLVTLPFIEGFWPLVGVTALVSFMLGRGTITLSYMTTALPDSVLNTGLGSLRTIYMTIGATSPAIFGAIAERGYFDEAFLLLAVLIGISLVLIWRLPDI